MQSVWSNLGAGISFMLGSLAIIWPTKIESFLSIKGIGKEGVSEIRATYGGFFVGIALYALITQTPAVFIAL